MKPKSGKRQPKVRRRYHHGDLRAALVRAGRELLAEQGLEGFTLRACARRAGVSHAAPAHHFPAVADLLAEIAATGFDDLTASMLRFAADVPPGDHAAHLVALGRGYVAFALANPAVFHLMFRREAFSYTSERFAAASKAAFDCLARAVDSLFPDDRERRDLAFDGAWSTVHGFATLVLEGQICKDLTDPAAVDERLAALLGGGRSAPGRFENNLHAK